MLIKLLRKRVSIKRFGLGYPCLAFAIALFQGCGEGYKIIGEGNDVMGIGVVSDTTALLAVRYYDHYEDDCCYPGGRADGYSYEGWGLKLVDVRKKEVYWQATTKDNGSFHAAQISDSIMVLFRGLQEEVVSLWVWKVGQNNPVLYPLTWTSEPILFDKVKPWKDGLLLAHRDMWSYFTDPLVLIDTAKGTLHRFYPSGEESWLLSCQDGQWNHLGGVCLQRLNDTCDYALIREGKDTLGRIFYSRECPDGYVSFYGDYFGLQNNTAYMNNPYPSKDANIGLFRVNTNGSIAVQPSFWIHNSRRSFVNSLGHVVEY